VSRFLIVAPAHESWGEFLHARQFAQELRARGHEVAFLVSTPMTTLLEGLGFKVGTLGLGPIDDAIVTAASSFRPDLIVLADAYVVFMNLAKHNRHHSFATRLDKIAALDVWDLTRTGLSWDLGDVQWKIPPEALAFERRLVPVPFAIADSAAFAALPEASGRDPRVGRARCNVGDDQRMLLITTASWQRETFQWLGPQRRSARTLPAWIGSVFASLPESFVVVHIGPERWPFGALEERYRWLPQCQPDVFREIMSGADVHVTTNLVARSIGEALRAAVPIVLAQSSMSFITADDPRVQDESLRTWLRAAAPVQPFRVWPYGLSKFLEPHTRGNPYIETLRIVEVFDAAGFREACIELASPSTARDAVLAAGARYVAAVDRLPLAAQRLEQWAA